MWPSSRPGWAAGWMPPPSSPPTCRSSPPSAGSTQSSWATPTSAILKEKAAVIPRKGKVVAGLLDPELKAELKEICAGARS